MRRASIIAAEPVALSVAPVPAATESKCAPSSTISSFSTGSLPGISAMTLNPLAVVSSWNFVCTLSSTLTGHTLVEDADEAVVVFDGERHRGQAGAGVGAARAAAGREDRAAVGPLLTPGHVAAAGGHVRVAAAVEERDDTFGLVEGLQLLLKAGGLSSARRAASSAPARRPRRPARARSPLLQSPSPSCAGRTAPRAFARRAPAV